MSHIIQKATDGHRSVELRVLKVNEDAYRFFTALGFESYSETPTHRLLRYQAAS